MYLLSSKLLCGKRVPIPVFNRTDVYRLSIEVSEPHGTVESRCGIELSHVRV